jgi:DsbC/DsbD-like thiol-disulfide interchange protein
MRRMHHRLPRAGLLSVVSAAMLMLHSAAAVASDEVATSEVRWHAAAAIADTTPAPGAALTVQIDADISPGWHVYAFHQTAGGPTALSIALADNSTAAAAGAVTGPAPSKQHDQSFDLDTETYSGTVELLLPLKINSDLPAGQHQVPVKIRFQSCSDRECRPPRTVQLDVDLNVVAKL